MRIKRDDGGKPLTDEKGKRIKERDPERWGKGDRYKVRYYDPDGNEMSESFPDRQLRKAQAFLTKMQHDVLAGVFIDANAGKVNFKTYAESWLQGQSQDAATRQTLRSRLRSQLYPFFEKRNIGSVNAESVRDWLAWLRGRNLEVSTQAVYFDTLSSILSAAVEDKKIRVNPCKAQSVKKPKPAVRKVVPWPESRLRAVQLALPPRFAPTAELGAGCGLRQGEILGFSLDDVNRDEMLINVTRQIRVIGGELVFAPPKGGKTRVVPLAVGVLERLDHYAENFEPVVVTLPWLEPSGREVTVALLMVGNAGRPYSGSALNEVVWKPAFKRAGLAYTTKGDGMHALRHLYASMLLGRDVSIKELAEYPGHSDPGFTLRTYTRLLPSSRARARKAVDQVYVRSGQGNPGRPDDGPARSTVRLFAGQPVKPLKMFVNS
ncbi:tyrosine-type recombinase/integrase [Actinosynnema sp. NPDC020468]|uniref:tyrosine-type recombinase/integrase n=1 Tax=Actinosynnema sp. NPDC020468 TaxID=3154488 RepID=UPI0033CC4013